MPEPISVSRRQNQNPGRIAPWPPVAESNLRKCTTSSENAAYRHTSVCCGACVCVWGLWCSLCVCVCVCVCKTLPFFPDDHYREETGTQWPTNDTARWESPSPDINVEPAQDIIRRNSVDPGLCARFTPLPWLKILLIVLRRPAACWGFV